MKWHATGLDPATTRAFSVNVAGTEVMLVPIGGIWHAIEDRCSHAGCTFSDDGEIDGASAVCNCHGSEFDVRTGSVMAHPAIEPIRTFAIRASAGVLEVRL
ncbi:MAG: Rieske 2Fe-2S domain-containing protein [Acidimicrobiia bacterium]|nr:Rieske 2Fe-2S domain-containing protein [Acidimicrobiia bacterium]